MNQSLNPAQHAQTGTPRTQTQHVVSTRSGPYQPMQTSYGPTTQPDTGAATTWQAVSYHLIPATVQRQREVSVMTADETCPICMEDQYSSVEVEGDDLCRYRTRCRTGGEGGHLFHFGCLARWFIRSTRCPTCRTDLSLSDVQFLQRETQRILRDNDGFPTHWSEFHNDQADVQFDDEEAALREPFRVAIQDDMQRVLNERLEDQRIRDQRIRRIRENCVIGFLVLKECIPRLLTMAFLIMMFVELADVSFTGCLTWSSKPVVDATGQALATSFMMAGCLTCCCWPCVRDHVFENTTHHA